MSETLLFVQSVLSLLPIFWLEVGGAAFVVISSALRLVLAPKTVWKLQGAFALFAAIVFILHPKINFVATSVYFLAAASVSLLFSAFVSRKIVFNSKRRSQLHNPPLAEISSAVASALPAVPQSAALSSGSGISEKRNFELEYALRSLEKLQAKKLNRSDEMEVGIIKTTLSLYRQRTVLSANETRVLNRHLSSLLKLMSKYAV